MIDDCPLDITNAHCGLRDKSLSKIWAADQPTIVTAGQGILKLWRHRWATCAKTFL